MKFKNVGADFKIIHGHKAQPPIRKPSRLARRKLSHFGKREPISVAYATELVLRLIEICASSHIALQKKAAARPPAVSFHLSTMLSGFQSASLHSFRDALAPTMSQIPIVVRKKGIKKTCHHCVRGFLLNRAQSLMFKC